MRKVIVALLCLTLHITCTKEEVTPRPYPRVQTNSVKNITSTGAIFNGEITFSSTELTDHGFLWSTNSDLNLQNADKVSLGAKSGSGAFEVRVERSLEEGVKYYVKAYAQTDDYFVYGEAVSFTSKGSTPPIIKSFTPLEGTWGDTITIKGNYFSGLTKNNVVKFGTVDSKVVASDDSTIMCIVPDNIETLLVSVYVLVTGNTTEAPNKFLLTVPQIDNFTPASGTFLDEVIISGSNFGILKTHVVTVGGHVAEVVEFNRNSLKVKIPLEVDLKTNQIKLVLNKQTATAGISFTMLPPTISSLSKAEGRIGDEVEITGENFNPRLMGNLVLFGESPATVVNATHNSLRVKLINGVYPQRISTVSVTVAEQTATSSSTFKLLDVWLKKTYTPVAEVNCGGFAIDNTGYFVAGSNTYSYDPQTSSWAQMADFPGSFRLSAITFAAAGHGYSGAGDGGCCGGSALTDFWRYSPSADTWTRRNDIPNESLGYNGTGVGSNGYTVQGFGPTQISEYDPDSDTWTTVGEILDANFTGYPHFPYSIFTMDDRIFVFFRDAYNYTSADNYLYEFHVATGKWTRRAAYFDESSEGFSINGTGYIKGFKSMHRYNLATNLLTLDISPLADDYWGMIYLFTTNEKAYFLGNWANSHFELWEFDPAYL